MIKYTTDFKPTLNGYLHLGHLYLMKINEEEAHRSGGQFGIILDSQRYWNWVDSPEQRKGYFEVMLKDLEWAGIKYDFLTSIDEQMPTINYLLEHEFHYTPEPEFFGYSEFPEVVGLDCTWYPYTDELTCHKVISDSLKGVNWCIRGWDLITEVNHYTYYTHKFRLPLVRQTLIPRLKFEGDFISKTIGNLKLKDFRERGADAKEVLEHLSIDCLMPYKLGWLVDNILLPQPHVGSWVKDYGFEL